MKSESTGRPVKRGFTLIELLISSTIALMILSVIYMFFKLGKTSYDYSEYSYILSREAHNSLRWVMRDLRETSLTSIRVYDENPTKESPVLAFHAASKVGDGRLEIGEFGTPLWQKHVIYTLAPDKKSSDEFGIKVGSLKRYEIATKDSVSPYPLPFVFSGSPDSPVLPQGLQSARVVLRHIVYDNQDLDLNRENAGNYRGFRVSFVKRTAKSTGFSSDTLSDENPALATDITGNSKLINCEFTILEASSTTGHKNILGLSFKVKPRN